MTVPNRDYQILDKILRYCSDIEFTHNEYHHKEEVFFSNPTYRNAIALCLLQIGELVKNLSDEFIHANQSIPWNAIRGMRNVVAHHYGKIDVETLWETSLEDIQQLQFFCRNYIANWDSKDTDDNI